MVRRYVPSGAVSQQYLPLAERVERYGTAELVSSFARRTFEPRRREEPAQIVARAAVMRTSEPRAFKIALARSPIFTLVPICDATFCFWSSAPGKVLSLSGDNTFLGCPGPRLGSCAYSSAAIADRWSGVR
jgi:hypothetical protein